jgi:hypothetical protein
MRKLVLLAIFQAGAWQVHAQPDAAEVKLEVRTLGDQRTFHIGEIIQLELFFSSTVDDKFRINTQNGDRSGRLSKEAYNVEPRAGWADPLETYYQIGSSIGGGLGSIRTLSSEPALVNDQLNEWVRFDQPGEYRLTVTSRRVAQIPQVESNTVALTIIAATPEWQEQTLRKALAALAESPIPRPYKFPPPDPGRAAIRSLRFLGTRAAAREMAHRVDDIDCVLGLAGFPVRKVALDELKKAMREPSFSSSAWVPHLMLVLTTPETVGDKR